MYMNGCVEVLKTEMYKIPFADRLDSEWNRFLI